MQMSLDILYIMQYESQNMTWKLKILVTEGQSAFSTGWEVCWMMFCIATVLVVLLGFQ